MWAIVFVAAQTWHPGIAKVDGSFVRVLRVPGEHATATADECRCKLQAPSLLAKPRLTEQVASNETSLSQQDPPVTSHELSAEPRPDAQSDGGQAGAKGSGLSQPHVSQLQGISQIQAPQLQATSPSQAQLSASQPQGSQLQAVSQLLAPQQPPLQLPENQLQASQLLAANQLQIPQLLALSQSQFPQVPALSQPQVPQVPALSQLSLPPLQAASQLQMPQVQIQLPQFGAFSPLQAPAMQFAMPPVVMQQRLAPLAQVEQPMLQQALLQQAALAQSWQQLQSQLQPQLQAQLQSVPLTMLNSAPPLGDLAQVQALELRSMR